VRQWKYGGDVRTRKYVYAGVVHYMRRSVVKGNCRLPLARGKD
jgi:hypothetical protein